MRMLSGNPGRVKATAPRLQTLSLDELGRSLAAEAAAAHAPEAAVTRLQLYLAERHVQKMVYVTETLD